MTTGRILITGATGFIGRHLVARLLEGTQDATLLVRNANAIATSWRENPRLRIIETGLIETAPNLLEAFADVGTVVHLSGLAHMTKPDEATLMAAHMAANAEATTKLAMAARAAGGVRTFVHLSSLAAITQNESIRPISDENVQEPTTPYGKSKRRAEAEISTLAENMFAVSLRPPLVVGAEAKGNWRLLQRLAKRGVPLPLAAVANRRSYVGVDTLVDAILHLCKRSWPTELSGSYCIANTGALSLAQVLTELRLGMDLQPRLFPLPPTVLQQILLLAGKRRIAQSLFGDLVVDSSRFYQNFGFAETTPISVAIHQSGQEFVR